MHEKETFTFLEVEGRIIPAAKESLMFSFMPLVSGPQREDILPLEGLLYGASEWSSHRS